MELRQTQLGTKDGECMLIGLLVTMVLEETPRAKQVNQVVESTVLEMKYLEDTILTGVKNNGRPHFRPNN